MRRTVPFAIYAELLREQRRESLVESDQVLRIFPTFKRVLGCADHQGWEGRSAALYLR